MGTILPFRRTYASGERPPIDTTQSPRQRVIKKLANDREIRPLMRQLVRSPVSHEPSPGNSLNTDTYAEMRARAESIGKIDDIVLSDKIIADGLFLGNFHALQGLLGETIDSWDRDIEATKVWPQRIREEAQYGEA